MTLVSGGMSLLLGVAYTALGVITAVELVRDRRTRGFSHFGAAFAVMAFTCGPHHLAHGTHVAFEGLASPGTVTAAVLIGMPAAFTWVGLRIEAAFGGRGERVVAGTPWWVHGGAFALAFASGAIVGLAVRAGGDNLVHGGPSVILGVNYAIVGLLMARTQVARRERSGVWSISGLSLATIFATCALVHLTMASTGPVDVHIFTIDLVGVPASCWFLYVTWRLHRASMADWNRRPLVGRAASTRRRSPWAAKV
jgi:hypothetical protein